MVGSIPTGPSDVPPIDANLRSERFCDDQCHPSGPKTLKKDLVPVPSDLPRTPASASKGRLSRGTAGRGRRKRAAFSERLHVVQRTRKLRGPLLNVLLPSGVVGQHRVVEEQCVNEL